MCLKKSEIRARHLHFVPNFSGHGIHLFTPSSPDIPFFPEVPYPGDDILQPGKRWRKAFSSD